MYKIWRSHIGFYNYPPEYWCTDGTRHWWQRPSDCEPLFPKRFTSEAACIKEIEEVLKPNYLDIFTYHIESENEDMKKKFVISKANANAAGETLYYNKNTSGNFWGKLSGEYTRKFSNRKAAEERAQELRTQTLSRFTLAVAEWEDVASEAGIDVVTPDVIPTDVVAK